MSATLPLDLSCPMLMMRVPPCSSDSLNQYPLFSRPPPALPSRVRLASLDLISAAGVMISDSRKAPNTRGMVTIQSMVSSFMPLTPEDRKSVVQGKSVSVRVDLGGCRLVKKKILKHKNKQIKTQQK